MKENIRGDGGQVKGKVMLEERRKEDAEAISG